MVEVCVERHERVARAVQLRCRRVDTVPRPGGRPPDRAVGEVVVRIEPGGVEFAGDLRRSVGEEVVAEHRGGVDRERPVEGNEGVERLDDLGGRLHDTAERNVGDVQVAVAQRPGCALAVRVVGQDRAGPMRGVDHIASGAARELAVELVAILVLVGDHRVVREAGHRNQLVAAEEHDVLELISVRVDDVVVDRRDDGVGRLGVARPCRRVPRVVRRHARTRRRRQARRPARCRAPGDRRGRWSGRREPTAPLHGRPRCRAVVFASR